MCAARERLSPFWSVQFLMKSRTFDDWHKRRRSCEPDCFLFRMMNETRMQLNTNPKKRDQLTHKAVFTHTPLQFWGHQETKLSLNATKLRRLPPFEHDPVAVIAFTIHTLYSRCCPSTVRPMEDAQELIQLFLINFLPDCAVSRNIYFCCAGDHTSVKRSFFHKTMYR